MPALLFFLVVFHMLLITKRRREAPFFRAGRTSTVAAALVSLLQVMTEAGIVGVAIDFGRHLQKQEAGWIVAVFPSGAISVCTQVAGETEIQGGAN